MNATQQRAEQFNSEREIERLEAQVAFWKEMNEERREIAQAYKETAAAYREGRDKAQACLSEIRALPDEWEKEGPCEEWAGFQDAAAQLRQILEKYNGLE